MAVLTIAGSCPDGGAGIQMDLKVFDAIGVPSASVITAITSQNTKQTNGFAWVSPKTISSQLTSVFSDMDIKAVKVGMSGHPEVLKVIFNFLKSKKVPIVIDPVMKAQADSRSLFEEGALPELKKLISISEVVVVNTEEAKAITDTEICSIADAEVAADRLLKMGAKAVLITSIKSGVMSDFFKSDFKFTYTKPVKLGGTKGGGSCMSSAIAAYLSMGVSVHSSVEYAEGFVDAAIANKKKTGKGIESLDPLATLRKDAERYEVLSSLKAALSMIESHNEFSPFIPETGSNIGYAIRDARNSHDVAAVVGRIRDAMGIPRSLGVVEFGASSRISSLLLSAMKIDSEKRASISVAAPKGLESACRKAGFSTVKVLGNSEPKGWDASWVIKRALKGGKVPSVILYEGKNCHQPIGFIFGRDAMQAASNALKIAAASYKAR
jgi:hydroxymethylpyrimidine kinase/phosphomethylpyrimidine kinase